MKTFQIIIIVVAAIVAIVLGFAAYWGAFKSIQFRVVEQGGETLVYEEMTGDYRQSGVVMDRVYYSLLNDYKIETFKGFGIYYDNPQKVETSKLRSELGCILEESDIHRLNELEGNFKIKTYPKGKYIVAEFPYKGKLSVIFGIMKVYPALNKYVKNNSFNEDGAIMEIYDTPGKKIVYRKAI
jgi:DNA gyrase inhibitor GyrI